MAFTSHGFKGHQQWSQREIDASSTGQEKQEAPVGEGKGTGDNKRNREPRGNAEHSQIYQATSTTAPFDFFL
jgi:hypothetical protein